MTGTVSQALDSKSLHLAVFEYHAVSDEAGEWMELARTEENYELNSQLVFHNEMCIKFQFSEEQRLRFV